MKLSTKQKIIQKAINLFNDKGYASVTLFEIAQALDMTRGNLTYHFKDKELLLKAIADEFWTKLETERNQTRLLPSFENMHNQVQLFYRLQRAYAFIFLDYHVLNHSAIRQQFKEMKQQRIKDMEATIAFSIAAGNMHPEPYEGIYHNLAFNTWMISFFWLNQWSIQGEDFEKYNEEGEKKLWSLLLPHLTEKGIEAFRTFFGEQYLKELGASFDTAISNYLRF